MPTGSISIERGEYPVTGRPERPPTHPGELLGEVIPEGLGSSVITAARQLGVSG